MPEAAGEVVDRVAHSRIVAHGGANPVDGMQHGAVVASTDTAADLREAVLGELAGQVHGHLSRGGDGRPAVARQEGLAFDAELLRGGVDDLRDAAGVRRAVLTKAPQYVPDQSGSGLLALQRGVGDDAD